MLVPVALPVGEMVHLTTRKPSLPRQLYYHVNLITVNQKVCLCKWGPIILSLTLWLGAR